MSKRASKRVNERVVITIPAEFRRFETQVREYAHRVAQEAVNRFEEDCLYDGSAYHADLCHTVRP